jgi:hypothetical protein
MHKYELIRLGLPITTATTTTEFMDIVDTLKTNPKWIAVAIANDEKNAPAGYKILRENNIPLVEFSVWQSNRDPAVATVSLLSQLHKLHSETLFECAVLLTPGSPYIDDAISKVLLSAYNDIKVIDTKSAPSIASDIITELTGLDTEIRNYHDDFVLMFNPTIDRSRVNIFSCLQKLYNVDLCDVVTALQPTKVITVNIGTETITKQYTYEEILECSDELSNSDTTYTFGFIFD